MSQEKKKIFVYPTEKVLNSIPASHNKSELSLVQYGTWTVHRAA